MDKKQFEKEIKTAFMVHANGRIAQIWKLRRELDLDPVEFDRLLMALVRECRVEVTGGDPSTLTREQYLEGLKVNNQMMIGLRLR